MKVVVTGAAGKLGSLTVAALVRRGFEVRATDLKFRGDLAARVTPLNLLDEHALYPLLEGADALVHLGNHPNRFAGPSPQRLLAENVAMNANAFTAALDLGVRQIVFASSIQVMIKSDGIKGDREAIPYLPLDGDAPANPGLNPYAQSKVFGEELLQTAARERPELCVTSLRYPMLVGEWFPLRVLGRDGKARKDVLHLGEGTAHLTFEDGAELAALVLEHPAPGYRQYFPAQTLDITNLPAPELIERFYPGVPRKRPLAEIDRLIDLSALKRDFGFEPKERLRVEFVEG